MQATTTTDRPKQCIRCGHPIPELCDGVACGYPHHLELYEPFSRATPRPWNLVNDGDTCNIYVEVPDGPNHGIYSIAEVAGAAFLQHVGGLHTANAALIVRAVNAFDDMRDILQHIVDSGVLCGTPETLAKARAALAKAQVKP